MTDAFYDIDGDDFIPTEWTRGPWDPLYQHAGPPAALVARAVELLDGGEDYFVAQFTIDVLRSIPLEPLSIDAHLVKPGRRVQLAEATLTDGAGVLAHARAWRIRRCDTGSVQTPAEPPPFSGPDTSTPAADFDPWNGPSYFSATEWRMAAGAFSEPGPATAWVRMRIPLVAGETPSPLTRVLVAADSGNGISQVLGIGDYLFVNVDLSVHLVRPARGEWVCIDATTRIGPEATGLATSDIYDEAGRLGAGNQSLLIAPR